MFPGKSNKILDIYLDEMKRYYETTSPQYNLEGFVRAICFAEDHVPKRLGEVYTKIVNFLLEKGDTKDAMDHAYYFKYNSKNKSNELIEKVESYLR